MSTVIINNPLVSEMLVFTLYKVISFSGGSNGFNGENEQLKDTLKAYIVKSLESHDDLAKAIMPTLSLGSQDVLMTSISLACFAEKAGAFSESIEGASRNDKIKLKTTSMLLQALLVKYDVIVDMYFNAYADIPLSLIHISEPTRPY